MHVGVSRLTFHVPHARSLKEKRSVVRKLRERIRARFEVSVAEVDAQYLHQRVVLGVAVVSADHDVCERVLGEVARFAELDEVAQLVGRATELVPFGDDLYEDDPLGR